MIAEEQVSIELPIAQMYEVMHPILELLSKYSVLVFK